MQATDQNATRLKQRELALEEKKEARADRLQEEQMKSMKAQREAQAQQMAMQLQMQTALMDMIKRQMDQPK